ncbi:MAG: hypothetical protein SOR61_06490 [Evtepia sp.]|uniref:hypothetical protein n=1 Tax=Evtepia sp. TaxID=2773933 RepID=UPI002A763239|nr:hypothetical protein [Evtepia sp.]MDY3014817.1 hypothetical protein [Evtepia sp.]
MKRRKHSVAAALLALMLLLGLTACTGEKPSPDPAPAPTEPTGQTDPKAPDAHEGSDPTAEQTVFFLQFPKNLDTGYQNNILSLREPFQAVQEATWQGKLSGDGTAAAYAHYWFDLVASAQLYVETKTVSGQETISALWTNAEGATTGRNVGVGSTERDILAAYTKDLYSIAKDAAEPLCNPSENEPVPTLDYDCAYLYQPFTPETNDVRDITFFVKNGKVTSIKISEPAELSYVYGYDHDAGLKAADDKRAELMK